MIVDVSKKEVHKVKHRKRTEDRPILTTKSTGKQNGIILNENICILISLCIIPMIS